MRGGAEVAAKAVGRGAAAPFKAIGRGAKAVAGGAGKMVRESRWKSLGKARGDTQYIEKKLQTAQGGTKKSLENQLSGTQKRIAKLEQKLSPKVKIEGPKPLEAPKPVGGAVAPNTTAKATSDAAKASEGAAKASEGAAAAAKAPADAKPKYEPPPPVAGEKSEGYRKAEAELTKNQEAAKKDADVIDINSGKKRGGGGESKGGGAQPEKAPATDAEDPAAAAAAAAEAPAVAGKIGDTLKKMQSGGWSSLNKAEKSQLITSGIGVVAGHRVLTGRDVISGEKSE
jgi:hypothetical protein